MDLFKCLIPVQLLGSGLNSVLQHRMNLLEAVSQIHEVADAETAKASFNKRHKCSYSIP